MCWNIARKAHQLIYGQDRLQKVYASVLHGWINKCMELSETADVSFKYGTFVFDN